MCGHFVSLSSTLRDVVGAEEFGRYCSMMFGVQIQEEGKPNAIEIRAIGGLRNSIKVAAMIMRLAGKNVAKHEGIPEQEALLRVLEDLKNDVLHYDAQKIE